MKETKEPKGSAAWLDEQNGNADAQTAAAVASAPSQSGAPKGTQEWAEQSAKAEPAVPGTQQWAEEKNGVAESKATPASDLPKSDDQPKAADAEKTEPAGVSAQNSAVATEGGDPNVVGFDQQIKLLQEMAARYKPESEEDRKKRERKEKRDRMWAAIGDGLQSLGNLFFTTKGAPNMYNHKTMSQQTPLEKRLREAKAERDADGDKYLNYALKIGGLNNAKAKTLREMEAQQEARRLAREKAKREQEAHDWLAALQPDKLREQKGKATTAEQKAITAGEEAKNAPELYEAKLQTEKARGEAQKAAATAHRASAGASSASAAYNRAKGAAVNPYRVYNKDTKRYEHFPTKDSAITAAQQYGTAVEVNGGTKTSTSTEPVKNSRGKVTGKVTKTSTSTTKNVIPASRETIEGNRKHESFSIHKK